MRVVWVGWMLLLLSLQPVWGETVVFACQPSDASLYLKTGGMEAYLIGQAGDPVALDDAFLEGRRPAEVVFRRPGWLEQSRPLPEAAHSLTRMLPGQSPPERLQQGFYYLKRSLPLWLSLGLVAGVVLHLRRRRARTQQARTRQRALEMVVPPSPDDPLVGTQVGDYLLTGRLGAGGMAEVYRAVPASTLDPSGEVAVKLIRRELSDSPEFRKRFGREVKICQSLDHPNLVRTLASGEHEGRVFLVMELLRGETLRERLDRCGTLPPGEAVPLVLAAMEALSAVHEQGVVHRDLKPENVFLTEAGQVKVMDFGVARGESFTVATATGIGMGTPTYMAPEQLHGAVSPAVDQYAAGVLLYELLSGRPPFPETDPVALAAAHEGRRAPALGLDNQALEQALRKMLEKSPRRRFPSLKEASLALQAAEGPGRS